MKPIEVVTGTKYVFTLQPQKKSIDIELIDELGAPMVGETYRIELENGTILAEDKLDRNGCAHCTCPDGQRCKVTFPYLEDDAYSYLGSSEMTEPTGQVES